MNKRQLQIAIYAVVILLSWVIVGLGSASHSRTQVTGLEPIIHNEEENHFISIDEIESLVEEVHGRPIEECRIGEVKIASIERSLKEKPYVMAAEAYSRLDGKVVVELELRRPLARVVYDDGSGFYISQDFQKMDLSPEFAANTLLLRGLPREPLEPRESIEDSTILSLRDFLTFVDASDYLRSLISEVVVDARGNLMIYPEVGDVVIEFGQPTSIAQKFANMDLFNRKVLDKVGWERYRMISLKYKGQVVAKRR